MRSHLEIHLLCAVCSTAHLYLIKRPASQPVSQPVKSNWKCGVQSKIKLTEKKKQNLSVMPNKSLQQTPNTIIRVKTMNWWLKKINKHIKLSGWFAIAISFFFSHVCSFAHFFLVFSLSLICILILTRSVCSFVAACFTRFQWFVL